ncbi:MAG: hypothetical protein RLZZ540_2425, partial [Bacteroidota bacterium]
MSLLLTNKVSLSIKPLDSQRPKKSSAIAAPPFTSYIVSQKGGGKSTLLLNMLTNPQIYKNKFHQVYLISPTSALDEKFDILRNTTITIANKPLIKLLKKTKRFQQRLVSNPNDTNLNEIDEDPAPVEFIRNLNIEWLMELIAEQEYISETFGKKNADHVLI